MDALRCLGWGWGQDHDKVLPIGPCHLLKAQKSTKLIRITVEDKMSKVTTMPSANS